MGKAMLWFMCDNVEELKEKKAKLLEEVKAIDEKIAELEG